ncbi:MAG: DUF3575 domain-containing protein [Bacteroidales bacterium]
MNINPNKNINFVVSGGNTKSRTLLVIIFCVLSFSGYSQKIALKTNAVLWATVSPNISAEFVVARNLSVDLGASFNVWSPYANIKMNNFIAQPELRYWFARPMAQHFVGFTFLYVDYDMHHKGMIYDGHTFGGGFTYGYDFVLNKRWNLELTAGIGLMYKWQYKYGQDEPRPSGQNDFGWFFAPVKVGVTVSYIIF